MSGRTKQTLYDIVTFILLLCALAGTFAMAFFAVIRGGKLGEYIALAAFCLVALAFPVQVWIHELGHLLCGLLSGYRFVSLSVNGIAIDTRGVSFRFGKAYVGQTQMLPKNGKVSRSGFAFFTIGGALFGLIYGGLFLALYFLVPITPALLFFELFAPLAIYEALEAVYPCELPAGRTDGKMLVELKRNSAYAKVFLSVIAAQGMLADRTYAEIPRELLCKLPVIRADEVAYFALAQLRWQYLFYNGDEAGAREQLRRLSGACEDAEVPEQVRCDLLYAERVLEGGDCVDQDACRGDSLAELRTRYALTGEGRAEAVNAAEKERYTGIRAVELKLIERADALKK